MNVLSFKKKQKQTKKKRQLSFHSQEVKKKEETLTTRQLRLFRRPGEPPRDISTVCGVPQAYLYTDASSPVSYIICISST